jgi:hypothetical protein
MWSATPLDAMAEVLSREERTMVLHYEGTERTPAPPATGARRAPGTGARCPGPGPPPQFASPVQIGAESGAKVKGMRANFHGPSRVRAWCLPDDDLGLPSRPRQRPRPRWPRFRARTATSAGAASRRSWPGCRLRLPPPPGRHPGRTGATRSPGTTSGPGTRPARVRRPTRWDRRTKRRCRRPRTGPEDGLHDEERPQRKPAGERDRETREHGRAECYPPATAPTTDR